MKKFAIVVLMALVAGSFAFAIDGVGDIKAEVEIGFDDINNGNKAGSEITIEPYVSYSNRFGIFGIEAGLGDKFYLANGDLGDKYSEGKTQDYLYLKVVPSLILDAGPGTLTFSITLKPEFYLVMYNGADTRGPDFIINPVINYTLDAGFASLGFEVGTDDIGLFDGASEDGDGYGLASDDAAYFKFIMEMPFGLSFWVSPRMYIAFNETQGDTQLSQIRADVSFQVIEEFLKVGVEGRFWIGSDTKNGGYQSSKQGLFIKPHVDIGLGNIAIWAAAEISHIGADSAFGDEIQIKPIVGASITF